MEGDEPDSKEASNNAFAFAKVWSAHKDALDEMADEVDDVAQADLWAQTLAKIADEQQRVVAQEKVGRGVRRKAAVKVSHCFTSPTKHTSNMALL